MLCYVKDKVVNINLVYLLSQIYWDCYILSIFLFLPVAKCLISLLCKSTIEMQHKSAVQSSKEIRTLRLFYLQHFFKVSWIQNEFMMSSFLPKWTKHYKDFCPAKQLRIVALFFGDFLARVGSFFFATILVCLVG